jgi:hypothetical protein
MPERILFSGAIKHLNPAEERWLREQLEEIGVVDGVEYPIRRGECLYKTSQSSSYVMLEEAEFAGCRAYLDMPGYRRDGDRCWVGFDYRFGNDGQRSDGWGRYMLLYSEAVGKIDRVGHLVQKFLRRFRPNDSWSMSYSASRKLRSVTDCGGGVLIITAAKIVSFDAFDLMDRCGQAFAHGKNHADQPECSSARDTKGGDLDNPAFDVTSVPSADNNHDGLDGQISPHFEGNVSNKGRRSSKQRDPVHKSKASRSKRSQPR